MNVNTHFCIAPSRVRFCIPSWSPYSCLLKYLLILFGNTFAIILIGLPKNYYSLPLLGLGVIKMYFALINFRGCFVSLINECWRRSCAHTSSGDRNCISNVIFPIVTAHVYEERCNFLQRCWGNDMYTNVKPLISLIIGYFGLKYALSSE